MENARRYFDIANEIGVGVPDHQLAMAMYWIRSGRFDEARSAVKLAFQMSQRPSDWIDEVFASLENPADSVQRRVAVERVELAVLEGQIPPYVTLAIWVMFGDVDRAMEIALQEAADRGAIYELEIVFIDEFLEFRRHPDFPKLMNGLGITRQWQSAGCALADGQLHCPDR